MVIESGTAHLESSYEQLWRNFNNYDLTAGKEVLYSIPFSDGRGRWNYHFAGSHEGTAYIGTAANRGGDVGPVPTLYFKYEAQDTRRDVSCVNFNWIEDGQEPAGIDMWYFGKYRFEWMDVQPYGGGNDDGLKPVVMRYSDILLMAAEITNELGNLNEAKDFLSQVRERAYAGNESMVTNYINGLADKNAVFNAIVDERALEFVGEFLRKADLIRWNLLNTKLDEAKAEMTALAQRTDEVYYSYNADGMGLTFWGLDPAQSGISPEGSQWILAEDYFSDFDTALIDAMYQADPNQHMFWPIFDITLTNSQGYLKNDYGY